MKYAVIKVINGNYYVHAEGFTDLMQAKMSYHGLCQTLWNAYDVISACVEIVNEKLEVVEGYREEITHVPQPVIEPTA